MLESSEQGSVSPVIISRTSANSWCVVPSTSSRTMSSQEFDFTSWTKELNLQPATVERLSSENLDCKDILASLLPEDLKELKLTLGETKRLLKGIESLRGASTEDCASNAANGRQEAAEITIDKLQTDTRPRSLTISYQTPVQPNP